MPTQLSQKIDLILIVCYLSKYLRFDIISVGDSQKTDRRFLSMT